MKETYFVINYCSGPSDFDHLAIMLLMLISSSFMKIMPILEIAAGEANCRLSLSNIKCTFDPNDILSPVGKVSKWLSSKTEFKA